MGRKVVVVADDTDEIRELIAETLTDEGYTVVLAANGAGALAIVATTEPALILLDLNRPVLVAPFCAHLTTLPQYAGDPLWEEHAAAPRSGDSRSGAAGGFNRVSVPVIPATLHVVGWPQPVR